MTRARIYQLFEMCADIMAVRWPEGEALFQRLYQKFASSPEAQDSIRTRRGLLELIYPTIGVGGAIVPEQRGVGRKIERSSDRNGARRGDRDFSRPRTNQRSTQTVSAPILVDRRSVLRRRMLFEHPDTAPNALADDLNLATIASRDGGGPVETGASLVAHGDGWGPSTRRWAALVPRRTTIGIALNIEQPLTMSEVATQEQGSNQSAHKSGKRADPRQVAGKLRGCAEQMRGNGGSPADDTGGSPEQPFGI